MFAVIKHWPKLVFITAVYFLTAFFYHGIIALLFYRTGSAAETAAHTPRPGGKAHKAGTYRIKVCVLYGEIRIERHHPDTLASAPQSYKPADDGRLFSPNLKTSQN